jgi:hypothetical protein
MGATIRGNASTKTGIDRKLIVCNICGDSKSNCARCAAMSLADLSARSSAEPFGFGGLSQEGAENHLSAVSWSAVVAGAFVTAALSLILLSLGTGLGLSSLSFWGNTSQSASRVGTSAILWLIFNEIVSSAMGGYLAGRLRGRWLSIHNDEVYFRDTVHGLLVWSVAVIFSVAFMAAAATSMAGAGPETRTVNPASDAYFVDTLFRSAQPAASQLDPGVRDETGRIITYALSHGDISTADENYLEQLVASHTGMDRTSAQKRVATVVSQAKEALATSQKSLSHLLLWIFIALLTGAFSSSVAATVGGRQRDHLKSI